VGLRLQVVVVVVLAALLPAGGNAHDARESVCRNSQLALSVGDGVSAATGQNPFTARLTNRSRVSCILNGYPTVSFSDRRGPLPVVVKQGGGHWGDQQVTLRPPRPVLLRPGRTAYVVLNKYRCDNGTLRVARTMRLALPGGSARGVGVAKLRSSSAPKVTYCRGGAQLNVMSVSPFVPSIAAGVRQW
jgi:hypothetical protein